MAAWTLTSTDSVVRLVHECATTKQVSFTLNGVQSLSASDVILLAKVPDQVYITDWTLFGTAGGDAQLFKLGVGTAQGATGGTTGEAALASAITFSATAQLKERRVNGAAIPNAKVSLSSDAEVKWTWVYLTHTSGTSTATASLQLTLTYIPVGGNT